VLSKGRSLRVSPPLLGINRPSVILVDMSEASNPTSAAGLGCPPPRVVDVGFGSIFQNWVGLRRSDRGSAVKNEAVAGASEVGMHRGPAFGNMPKRTVRPGGIGHLRALLSDRLRAI
jgi:hypothetical protein